MIEIRSTRGGLVRTRHADDDDDDTTRETEDDDTPPDSRADTVWLAGWLASLSIDLGWGADAMSSRIRDFDSIHGARRPIQRVHESCGHAFLCDSSPPNAFSEQLNGRAKMEQRGYEKQQRVEASKHVPIQK